MSVLEDFVLALNKNWVPIDTCTVRSAFTGLFSGNCKFVDMQDFTLHSVDTWLNLPVLEGMTSVSTARLTIRAPEVLVWGNPVSPEKTVMAFSRRNLLKRDRGQCQYCGRKPNPKDMTIEHIFPRARGGKTSWSNCVMACEKCNNSKKDRTPAEAGMKLIVRPEMRLIHPHDQTKWNQPYEPAWSPVFKVNMNKFKNAWTNFLTKGQSDLAKA